MTGAQSAGNWGPHRHLNENPEIPHRPTPRHCSPPPACSPGSDPSPGPGPGPAERAGRPTGGGAGAGPGGAPANGAGPCPPRARLRPAPPRRRRAAELPALSRPRCPVRRGPLPRRSPAADPGSGPARSQAPGNCRRPPPPPSWHRERGRGGRGRGGRAQAGGGEGGAGRRGCGSRQLPAPLRVWREPGAGPATRGAPRERESAAGGPSPETAPEERRPRVAAGEGVKEVYLRQQKTLN